MRIVVVEDEPSLARVVEQALSEAGYEVAVAQTIAEAVPLLAGEPPDLLLLDLMLPDGDGLDLLKAFRKRIDAPVLILTARDQIGDRVRGLDAGADDYLVKPFRLEELMARVRALLRRSRGGAASSFTMSDLHIDFVERRVSRAGRLIFLSTTEYALLEFLARAPGQVRSKAAILRYVWDDDQRGPNVVEVYVNYLRHKLERNGAPRLLHTVRRQGYVLSEAGEA